MKLIFQITLGVFLGTLLSHLAMDSWHARQDKEARAAAERLRSEQEKVRMEQGKLIRNLILQNRQHKKLAPQQSPPESFIPDEAQTPQP